MPVYMAGIQGKEIAQSHDINKAQDPKPNWLSSKMDFKKTQITDDNATTDTWITEVICKDKNK